MPHVAPRFDVWIPLRDGTRLHAARYDALEASGPGPCLVTLTPYTADGNHRPARYLAERGYTAIVVETRGRGDSGGEFRPFDEAEDGHDIVEWLARQPYCDGQVGMFGGSYAGYAQWATAKTRPPHLATIVPAASAAPGIDLPMRNNISLPYAARWLTLTSGRTQHGGAFGDSPMWTATFREFLDSGLPFPELGSFVGNQAATFREWASHPVLDDYWDARRPTAEEYEHIDIPILSITGTYDAAQPGALHYYREHMRSTSRRASDNHHLILGPWEHSGTRSPIAAFGGITLGAECLVDLLALHVEWFDWVMRAGEKPEFLEDAVAYYTMGRDEWRFADSLESVAARTAPLFLTDTTTGIEGGRLSETRRDAAPAAYTYDPLDPRRIDVEGTLRDPQPLVLLRPTHPTDDLADDTLVEAERGWSFIWDGERLEEEATVSGFFRLEAWISIDQPDTDFKVAVYEVRDGGHVQLLSSDVKRARHRESLHDSRCVDSGVPHLFRFDGFTFVSKELARGSRLRLTLGPLDSIYWQRNYNSDRPVAEQTRLDARPVVVTLYQDESHPSALYVPYGYTNSSR
jgi:putative CocE/NonD family hydrolase